MIEHAKTSLRNNARRKKGSSSQSADSKQSQQQSQVQPAQQEQQQALYTTSAHAFQINPETKKSWMSLAKQAVNVSFYYDSGKSIYRIISVDGPKVLINSTITAAMTFHKTSQKFGQWSDAKNNTFYGLGFPNEGEMAKFESKFLECKNNVRSGTPPSTPRSSKIIGLNNGSVKSMSTNSAGSLDNELLSPGSHHSGSSAADNQMKYENDRLKKALAQSSANAKKWEQEIKSLKNNNARLTAALHESSTNVEKWKEQLNNYKEENSKLKKKVKSSSGSGGSGSGDTTNTRELEQKLEEMSSKLSAKDEELNKLTLHSSEELSVLREKNAELNQKVHAFEVEKKHLLSDDGKRSKELESKTQQFNDICVEMDVKLKELTMLQTKFSTMCTQ